MLPDLKEKSALVKASAGTLTIGAVGALLVGQVMLMGVMADLFTSAIIFGIGFAYGRYGK
jgi:hypothetical protein